MLTVMVGVENSPLKY